MNKNQLIKKIMQKKEFSQLPMKEVEMAFEKFNKSEYLDEEKIKLTRSFLRKIFSGFGGKKLLNLKNLDKDYILKKHLSTRERYGYYNKIYSKILKELPNEISVIDFGAGVNGMSYEFFEDIGKKVNYIGVEAMGQFVDLMNQYFSKNKLKGKAIHLSLFDVGKIKEIIKKQKKPRIILMFKVIDALEKFERDYTKKLLKEIMPLIDRCILSFATESWVKRKKFYVQRKWILDFIKENWKVMDDFETLGERYLVLKNK